jgi:LysR family transcriptional regulator, hydrogen peroxide-inducible genes activator
MDLHHIRYFLAVCDTLNFTRAAEKCNVTQPALSRAIQQLEDDVGGPLFRRERNLTHPTDLAFLVKPRLQQIVDGLGEAEREVKRFLTMGEAGIALGIMCTVGPTRFTGLLAGFQTAHPAITLNLVEGIPKLLLEKLTDGSIDLAIMASPQKFPEHIETEVLYRERFLVAFPVGHRFDGRDAIPITDVDGENYLLRYNCEYESDIDEMMKERNCSVNVVYESEREDWIQNMVAGGLGICFIPEFSAVIPGLQAKPVVNPEIWRNICVATAKGRAFSPTVTQFIERIRAHRWAPSRFPMRVDELRAPA